MPLTGVRDTKAHLREGYLVYYARTRGLSRRPAAATPRHGGSGGGGGGGGGSSSSSSSSTQHRATRCKVSMMEHCGGESRRVIKMTSGDGPSF